MNYMLSIANRENVKVEHLDYIGFSDESKTIGAIIHYYNVLDKSHEKYMSTVCFIERIKNDN